MISQAETRGGPSIEGIHLRNSGNYLHSSHRKTVLLIESRTLMGEIFCHALKDAAADLDVRVLHTLDEARPEASLAVFSFVQRNSDPLFVAFVVQQLRVRLGDMPLLIITDSVDPAAAGSLDRGDFQGWVSAAMGFDVMIEAIRNLLASASSRRAIGLPSANRHDAQLSQAAPARLTVPNSAHGLRSDIHLNLTDREIDVLSLLKKGKQNKVIAHVLNISESTAKVHIRNIMRKFHLRNRTEVALMCGNPLQQGDAVLVGPDYNSQMALMEVTI